MGSPSSDFNFLISEWMKKTVSLFWVIVLMAAASCIRKENGQTAGTIRIGGIEFFDTIHHFGDIRMEQPVDSFDFKFVNRSGRLLVILDARTSCHCTRVFFQRQPVPPDDTSYIRVIYDGTDRSPEYFNKSVTVYTNVADELIELRIDGNLKL